MAEGGISLLAMPLRLRYARTSQVGRQVWQTLNWHSPPLSGNQGFDGFVGVTDVIISGFGLRVLKTSGKGVGGSGEVSGLDAVLFAFPKSVFNPGLDHQRKLTWALC
jgi:hypothetical protein